MHLCKADSWEERDLDKDVFDMLTSKPAIAKTNNYINQLYLENRD
jgi:hypothetical protein